MPSEAETQNYWKHFKKLPYVARHSIHRCVDNCGKPLDGKELPWPMHIHVDGVKVYKSSGQAVEHLVWSFSAATVKLTCRRSKFWLTHVPLHLYTGDTNFFLVAAVRWILRVLSGGCTPRRGLYQEELTDRAVPPGTRFAPALLAGVKTDAKEKRVQHHCHICRFDWFHKLICLPQMSLDTKRRTF